MEQVSILTDIRKIISEKISCCLTIVCLALGFLIMYGWASQQLGTHTFVVELWEPLAVTGSAMHLAVVILIFSSVVYNHYNGDQFNKGNLENPEILYLMCLPMVIFNIFALTITLTKDITNMDCYGKGNVGFDSTAILYFIAILILLVQSNGLYDFGEVWDVNFINMTTILIAIASQIYFICLFISREQVRYYENILNNTMIKTNCNTSNSSISYLFYSLWHNTEPFMNKCIIISGFSCSVFLLKPFIMHYNHLQRLKRELIIGNRNYVENSESSISIGIVAFCLIIGLSVMGCVISMWDRKDTTSVFLYSILIVIIYIVMIISIIFQLHIMKDWVYQCDEKLKFNEVVIWMGLGGQMFHTFSMIAISLYRLGYEDQHNISLSILILFKYLLQTFQNIMQSLIESILLEKKWMRPTKEKSTKSTLAMFFLSIQNLVLGLSDLYLAHNTLLNHETANFSRALFTNLSYRIGTVFSILQRFHASLLFLAYLRFVYNKNEL